MKKIITNPIYITFFAIILLLLICWIYAKFQVYKLTKNKVDNDNNGTNIPDTSDTKSIGYKTGAHVDKVMGKIVPSPKIYQEGEQWAGVPGKEPATCNGYFWKYDSLDTTGRSVYIYTKMIISNINTNTDSGNDTTYTSDGWGSTDNM